MYLIAFFLTFFIIISIPILFPEKQPRITYENGMPLENSVTKWEKVTLGNCEQWISIRGSDRDNPVLLFLHGGPGTPETPFLLKYNGELEKIFVVISWDQRGAGKSFRKDIPPESMNADQFTVDTHELTHYLKEKFGKEKIYIMGHSWGALLGIRVAHQYPEDYYAYCAVTQISDCDKEELLAYQRVYKQAKDANIRNAVKELEEIGKQGELHTSGERGSRTLHKWARYFGGAAFYKEKRARQLVKDVLTTPAYSLREKLNYFKGEKFSLKCLYEEMRGIKLHREIKSLRVPVYFFHGAHDNQVPLEIAREFFEGLKAPKKKFNVFEHSAHGVFYEEPEKFHRIMEEISGEDS